MRKKSTRARPSPPIASNARTRDALHLGELAVAEVGRADQLDARRVEVLGLEVVEVAARDDDLAGDARRARRSPGRPAEHADLDLAADDGRTR